LHPNLQSLSIQGLLVLGAILALLLPGSTEKVKPSKAITPPAAGVGV
jgi:hypothetical protein